MERGRDRSRETRWVSIRGGQARGCFGLSKANPGQVCWQGVLGEIPPGDLALGPEPTPIITVGRALLALV